MQKSNDLVGWQNPMIFVGQNRTCWNDGQDRSIENPSNAITSEEL